MEHSYSMHGHNRSLSSLASTIMPVTSEPSACTSMTASPMESHDPADLPSELKIPLPTSSGSDQDGAVRNDEPNQRQDTSSVQKDNIQVDREDPTVEPEEDNHGETENAGVENPIDSDSATLEELAHLVQMEAFAKGRAVSTRKDLQKQRLSCGLDKRLSGTLSIAYGDMIDQYKTDDQAGFAGLYEACEQLKATCVVPNEDPLNHGMDKGDEYGPLSDVEGRTGIRRLPLHDQENILRFISSIRTEADFLADRISQLSSAELTALTSSYHPPGIDFSILQNHSHGKSQAFSRDSQMMKLSRRMDNINWFHNQDPFFALLHSVFDSSAKVGSSEYSRRIAIWSATCARTMVDGFNGSRPSSDEFVIASIDAFVDCREWALKPRVQVYIMDLLSKGAFLLDGRLRSSATFKEPEETQNAKIAVAEVDYFDKALFDLFDLLTVDGIERAVPQSALDFTRAILRRIEDPKLRLRAQQFIVIRWYFATFVSSVLTYPEVCGTMMTQYIGEAARRLLLQKLVVKLQERVFDVVLPWSENVYVHPGMREKIMNTFRCFDPPALSTASDPSPLNPAKDEEAPARFLILSDSDIAGLVRLLCPDRGSSQGSVDPVITLPISNRPSTAGSSTLVAESSDVGSAVFVPTMQSAAVDANQGKAAIAEGLMGNKDSSDTLRGESEAAVKSKEMPQQDFESQLRLACEKLKTVSPYDITKSRTPFLETWTFMHPSEDGMKLSLKSCGDETSSEASAAPTGLETESSQLSNPNDVENLKAAVVKLLKEAAGSGQGMSKPHGLPKAPMESGHGLDTLESLMEAAVEKAHLDLNFASFHFWWRSLQTYRDYLARCSPASSRGFLVALKEDLQRSVNFAVNVSESCEAQSQSLSRLRISYLNNLSHLHDLRNTLRIKMWYTSDVRHSAPYEEALLVTRALRTMASSKRPRQPSSLSAWARQRLRGSHLHDRAETQTLEAMVSSQEHGGLSKLADEQIELTTRWLTRKSIENFCKGEERIHRFCFEVQRSVAKIAGTSLLESPVLWSSHLFKRERLAFDSRKPSSLGPVYHSSSNFFQPMSYEIGRLPTPTFGAPAPSPNKSLAASPRSPFNDLPGLHNTSSMTRQPTGLGLYGDRPVLPPTPISPPPSWSNDPFGRGSPLHTISPPMPFEPQHSIGRSQGDIESDCLPEKTTFAEAIKRKLCSLLISDLGYLLWNRGSETDIWFNDHAVNLGKQEQRQQNAGQTTASTSDTANDSDKIDARDAPNASTAQDEEPSPQAKTPPVSQDKNFSGTLKSFPFSDSYASILRRISLTHDPYKKLQLLHELQDLVYMSLAETSAISPMSSDSTRTLRHHERFNIRSRGVPRTKATNLEEVIANCTERRADTMNNLDLRANAVSHRGFTDTPSADDVVEALGSIFRDPKTQTGTLFRDLQYIAAFVPTETLDKTLQGRAFWDAGLAALALKEDLCHLLVGQAAAITDYHIASRTSIDPASDIPLASTTLRDAANLWLIPAKEGSPVAARELGLFYLTHPELLSRVTMPFSKAKDVFGFIVSNDIRASDKEKGALDPYTFAVVFHWMEIAANGGDKDARDFLKGNGELSGR